MFYKIINKTNFSFGRLFLRRKHYKHSYNYNRYHNYKQHQLVQQYQCSSKNANANGTGWHGRHIQLSTAPIRVFVRTNFSSTFTFKRFRLFIDFCIGIALGLFLQKFIFSRFFNPSPPATDTSPEQVLPPSEKPLTINESNIEDYLQSEEGQQHLNTLKAELNVDDPAAVWFIKVLYGIPPAPLDESTKAQLNKFFSEYGNSHKSPVEIPEGHAGILLSPDGKTVLQSGTHLVNPFSAVFPIDLNLQHDEIPLQFKPKPDENPNPNPNNQDPSIDQPEEGDLSTAIPADTPKLTVQIQWKVDSNKLLECYDTYGTDYKQIIREIQTLILQMKINTLQNETEDALPLHRHPQRLHRLEKDIMASLDRELPCVIVESITIKKCN